MRLIIGLGNPGEKYAGTRHNFGQMVVDFLASKKQISWHKDKALQAQTADFRNGTEKIILAKTETFMNESGQAVQLLKKYYKLPNNKIIVIYDDIDLPLGKIRLSKGRGAGGHKGVESIIAYLHSKDFKRLRLGIAPQLGPAEDFVLKKFGAEEKNKVPEIIDTCHLVIEYILKNNFDLAANKYNEKSPE
ncbi:MAG: aminoacyl-tRNA hydrolase [Parcubacteria group bacterium]|nr:MAG: aminoacyl-tRNA hydrolase [Parcubacteria group bacterium]